LLTSAATAAGELHRFSPARSQVAITESFSAGVASATALRDIAARADDFYRDALTQAARSGRGGAAPLEVSRLVETIAQPPAWLPEFLELSAQVGARPQYATDALRFADLLLFEQLIAGNPVPDSLLQLIPSPADELLRLIQLGGGHSCNIAACRLRSIDTGIDRRACLDAYVPVGSSCRGLCGPRRGH
jgi:hypothetical protein